MDVSDYVKSTFICSQHPNVHTLSGREVVGVRLLAELIGSHLCRVLRQLRREVSLSHVRCRRLTNGNLVVSVGIIARPINGVLAYLLCGSSYSNVPADLYIQFSRNGERVRSRFGWGTLSLIRNFKGQKSTVFQKFF